ncbi:hypothetical protein DPMN_065722 [Dreissena polymorpha]|uniref:Uncharacterized protein n=1 Tax=Dreissena polymorpha TaxID=45954 RepID=A0A9D4BSE6_DREPO|nr:hypothetical protein DPMN_065722 [Dreissena polymorpha]
MFTAASVLQKITHVQKCVIVSVAGFFNILTLVAFFCIFVADLVIPDLGSNEYFGLFGIN